MKSKITTLILAFLFVFSQNNYAQNNSSLWTKIEKSSLSGKEEVRRASFPVKAEYYHLDLNYLKQLVAAAPDKNASSAKSNLIIPFPMGDGSFENFRVWEASIMHPDLAAKFPMIKTYVAQGIDDPTASMRFTITQLGLHTQTLSGKRMPTYIDPFTTDLTNYIVYDKSALQSTTTAFECLTDDNINLPSLKTAPSTTPSNIMADVNDKKLRKYRLAQSCTGEYGSIFKGTGTTAQQKANVQAQMTITMARVNGVYERDLAITLEFIPNNDTLIYLLAASDPWTGEYNTKTAQTIDANVGINNYDIGHNFNTSGGGNAGCLSCVCQGTLSSQAGTHKGRGMTGSSNPTGDPFDIDYVAHEMGHQFGGYHTMNTCSRSGNGQTEVEPCSGSSVMGYAGICSVNVQNNSDAHFIYNNIRDISSNVQTGNSTCAAITTLTNNPPTADAGNDYNIPKGTAFILEGIGNDPDGNASLTYEWCQNDPAEASSSSAPQSTWTTGPMYRAKYPTTSPNRYMPRIQDVIAGNLTPTWEVTPSVGRTLNFSFLVRDNDALGGQVASDLMTVNVNGTAGPFIVTSQSSTGIILNSGSSFLVEWNVAGTTAAPVSTPNVNIYLSKDGGLTYPVTLATNVPNSGSANVVIPPGNVTTQGRIMVRGAGNIFYAINSKNFTVQDSEFVMSFSNTTSSNCPAIDATYNFTYNTFLSFNETTTFSANGHPAGSVVTFNPTSASADGTPVQVTISGLTPAMAGSYAIDITGTATSVTKLTTINLNVLDPAPTAANLTSPTDAALGVDLGAVLTWSAGGAGSMYDIEIATDNGFTNIIDNATGLTTNNYTSSALINATTYYWRVTTYTTCGTAPASAVFSFTTSSCAATMSTDVPKTISTSGTPTATSTINITSAGSISDVNVVDLEIAHSWVGDVVATLTSPQGTTINLFNQPGVPNSTYGCSGNDISVSFDDAASLTSANFESTCNNAPAISGTYQPLSPLSALIGESMTGTWTLTVQDMASGDGGSLTGWGLNICSEVTPTGVTTYAKNNEVRIFPNPTSNMLMVDLGNLENVERITLVDLQGKVIYESFAVNSNIVKIDMTQFSNGFYMLQVQGKEINNVFKVLKQ
ncbi:MAG: T9SS type A sorting domain-containing protein [Flavobacteriales bacterium]|nr:MAG: T9SS type A sorting domain-containing protein [Flavobacteriales bacterium]